MINHIAEPFLALPRPSKRLLALGVDALLCGLTVWLALCLRLERWVVLTDNQWLALPFTHNYFHPDLAAPSANPAHIICK